MNTVLDALLESLEGLKVTFGDTPESFKRDKAQTGDVREASVSDLLRSYFPTTWTVGKGPIYGTGGRASQSIDSVLCSPSHPPMRTGKRSVLLAEAVHSATETKPNLEARGSTSELHRGLEQIVSVKRLERELEPLAVAREVADDPEHHRIPCALFTAKLGDVDSALEYMDKFKASEGVKPPELPDVIVALDRGVIYHAADVSKSLIRSIAAKAAGMTEGEVYAWLPESDHRSLGTSTCRTRSPRPNRISASRSYGSTSSRFHSPAGVGSTAGSTRVLAHGHHQPTPRLATRRLEAAGAVVLSASPARPQVLVFGRDRREQRPARQRDVARGGGARSAKLPPRARPRGEEPKTRL